MNHLSFKDRFFLFTQRCMPKQAMTELAGRFANGAFGNTTQWAINTFIKRYGVNMQEAQQEDPTAYETFNDFFTRALKPTARPLANSTWVSPVDGTVSQLGQIAGERVFQAKGHHYSLLALLGGDADAARTYANGDFATLYLSPKDYHRIHLPCAGTLRRMVYVPGDLYSVNPLTAQNIPGLFARNERLVCHFDTAHGPLAVVFVAATIVGSMATVWHGRVNAQRLGLIQAWDYEGSTAPQFAQGDEIGRFMLGSTVVLCWANRANLKFDPEWRAGRAIQMGQSMATVAGESITISK